MKFARYLILLVIYLLVLPLAIFGLESQKEIVAVINRAITKVDQENLRQSILHLENYGNRMTWQKQWETAQWVLGRFKELGIESRIQTYEYARKTWPNVSARIRGKERYEKEKVVMLIAHFDSISDDPKKGAPGADDNGSGVAVILETARILKEIPLRRTVMFSLFSNEEQGSIGSKVYALQAKQNGLDIRAVINLDVLGYNCPTSPFSISAINVHKTFKYKIKAFLRMARNYIAGFRIGRDAIKVAGKEPNRELVSVVSQVMWQQAELKVKEVVGEDCG